MNCSVFPSCQALVQKPPLLGSSLWGYQALSFVSPLGDGSRNGGCRAALPCPLSRGHLRRMQQELAPWCVVEKAQVTRRPSVPSAYLSHACQPVALPGVRKARSMRSLLSFLLAEGSPSCASSWLGRSGLFVLKHRDGVAVGLQCTGLWWNTVLYGGWCWLMEGQGQSSHGNAGRCRLGENQEDALIGMVLNMLLHPPLPPCPPCAPLGHCHTACCLLLNNWL